MFIPVRGVLTTALAAAMLAPMVSLTAEGQENFQGKHYQGKGDIEYLQLLEWGRRMFDPDPEFASLPMLYTPRWNGFVEGPTWGMWWIQNSYGTSYCALPFLQEPYVTFLENSQALWFDRMGDGKRESCPGDWRGWIAPDGQLCDAAAPGCAIVKQGDGRIDIHDWGVEFTAAGVMMQSELLLISRDTRAIARYLPLLERSADFIETRRNPKNNLFWAGPAGNLLAPSYAGWKKPDGTYDKAYLAGLSITYIAALDRLIELEKLAGAEAKVRLYSKRRELARKGLPLLMTEEGYFIKQLDPDGTRHGVFGAPKHGYFEAVANHDAIAFRIVDDAQAQNIYSKMASIPGLRPHDVIITNYPGLDDMYEQPKGLWRFGHWVNGGHWSTCEGRMMLAYSRLGKYEDARRSMRHIMKFAREFRMDNPLVDFGKAPYQPREPVNIVYDAWAVPAALIRGLFEYLYKSDGLTLLPHIPPGITELRQLDAIRFGKKRLHLSTVGTGRVSGVTVNGRPWKDFNAESVHLFYDTLPGEAEINIALGGAEPIGPQRAEAGAQKVAEQKLDRDLSRLDRRMRQMDAWRKQLAVMGRGGEYEAAHARLIGRLIAAAQERRTMLSLGKLEPLPDASRAAADQIYLDTIAKLCDGLETVLWAHEKALGTAGAHP